jgi:divalent metal cation (Fe/Co/Zn/Cd) transporter
MLVSMAVDFWRSRALGRIASKYDSQALQADALHFSTDIWSSGIVIIGLVLVSWGIALAFGLVGLALHLFMAGLIGAAANVGYLLVGLIGLVPLHLACIASAVLGAVGVALWQRRSKGRST